MSKAPRILFLLLAAAASGCITAAIWTGDERWATTACVPGFAWFVMFLCLPLWWGGKFGE